MSKYSCDLKIIIANQCLAGEASRELSKIYSISSRQIRYWAQVVAIHDDNTFLPTPHLRCAKARFQALKLMWTNDWSFGHTSTILNLTTLGILSLWLDRYNQYGFKGLEYGPGRPSMKSPHTTPVRPDDEKNNRRT